MPRKPRGRTIAPPTGGEGAMFGELSDFERLLQKAIEDDGFASRLMLSPADALTELNITVTQDKLRALADCVDPLVRAYEEFGGIRRLIG